MNIKLSLALLITLINAVYSSSVIASETSVKHLQLPEMTSLEEAKQVFSKTTSQLQEKNKLDDTELHEIHMITYSLEKAVAYFFKETQGEQQAAVKEIADVVELIHIASENNRAVEVQEYLQQYFTLAEAFSPSLKQ